MTTLEKIRAEITELFKISGVSNTSLCFAVLDLIDKYASEECDHDCEHCAYLECPKEPCEDAVSRQLKIGEEIYIRANVNEIRNDYIICENKGGYFGTVREEIYPSVQPEPKTGHWIEREVRGDLALYCSECEAGLDVYYHYSFCPNCGAEMKGGAE